ncbi:Hypothetical protein NTJ_04936 [Nesidiocoris tenuis]|uniref:Uncharacterized protein n=1 Tax=Nesidiocoris tenuis TaxID=355587 RepID=A0ABN7AIP1_9HEMI|nr:Hypothetical protein NTJ_04936 [Nesidiocoris tenuis]
MAFSEDEVIREIMESAAEGRGEELEDQNSRRKESEEIITDTYDGPQPESGRKLTGSTDAPMEDSVSPNRLCGPGKEPEPEKKNDPGSENGPKSCGPETKKESKTSCVPCKRAPKRKKSENGSSSSSKTKKAKKAEKTCPARCVGCGKRRSSKSVSKNSRGQKNGSKKSQTAKCSRAKNPKDQ